MQIRKSLSGACCLLLFATAASAIAASVSGADRNFLITAAKIDMTAANEGQLAENQATREDVKGLAKTLVQDYTESYWHLSEVAAKTGVTIPKGIDSGRIASIRELTRLKSQRFDSQFAREEAAADRQAIALFKREAAHGLNADVKAYAARMIPVLEKDLKLAEDCAKAPAHS